MTSLIHPTAIVHPGAQIHPSVQIGPYCILGPDVVLEEGVILHAHVVIQGGTRLGAFTHVYPFASLGFAPQHLHYQGEPGYIEVGQHVIIREHVTINIGMTEKTGRTTRVGSHSCLFIGSHVGHDVSLGEHVTIINNVLLGGHVVVDDWAVVSGCAAVHPFCRIGKGAFVSGLAGVNRDIIPYGYAYGQPTSLMGLNVVGLRRRGIQKEAIRALREVYKLLFYSQESVFKDRIDHVISLYKNIPEVMDIISFLRGEESGHSICHPPYHMNDAERLVRESGNNDVFSALKQFKDDLSV